jgi:hypothetical protein
MHGGPSPGAPIGNKNALKHGLYTAEAIARRREMSAWMRAMSHCAAPGDVRLDARNESPRKKPLIGSLWIALHGVDPWISFHPF